MSISDDEVARLKQLAKAAEKQLHATEEPAQVKYEPNPLEVMPLTRTIHYRDDGKPLVRSVKTIDRNAPLSHDIIETMSNNIFVNLRTQFPALSRRELRAETRRRLNIEIKRRKEIERASSAKDAGSENLGPAVTDSPTSS